MSVFKNLLNLIGNTPILMLSNYAKHNNLKAGLFGKLECFNPAGSVKDRVAHAIIADAEQKGIIKRGSVIVEPTSGNTGIGLACICAAKGYNLILTMPENMSMERISLIKAYGAKVELTKKEDGMAGAIKKAEEILKSNENSYMPNQFSNPVNPEIHKLTTGPEIYKSLNGNIDFFVAGIGTGGTISGVGEYLKSKNNKIKIIGVEPYSSPVLTKKTAGPHKIQGIGAGFVPENLNINIYDEIICVRDEEAYYTTKIIAKYEGILVGISSGASIFAASLIAKKQENLNKVVVAILPDGGEKYISTGVYL